MLISVGILFGCIFGFIAIKNYMIAQYMKSGATPAVSVSTTQVKSVSWQPHIKASGSLRAVRGVDVTTEIAGLVRSIEFTPGARVNAGDLLVKLNTDSEVAQLHALEAEADLAQITLNRDTQQFAVKAVSQATLDTDAANLKEKRALVAEQLATIAKKTITAPFTGRLGISMVNPGQYINPGDKIVTLQSLDPIYVDFYVPQQMIGQLATGQTVSIVSDSFPDKIFSGTVTTIDPKVDPATRNIQVEATIANPDYQLLPGMFAKTEVNIGNAQAHLTLPLPAISFNPYGELVYIIRETGKDKNGKPLLTATQSFVTVGEAREDQIVVLKGVKAGDIVVTSGQLKLKNGSPVVINNTVIPESNPNFKPADQP